jgi:hypothetical protein
MTELFALDEPPLVVKDNVPIAILLVGTIQGHPSQQPLTALFDSGSTSTWFHERMLPNGAVPAMGSRVDCATAAGILSSKRAVYMKDIVMPDFVRTRHIDGITAHVFGAADCRYDVILGRDYLSNIGLILNFQDYTVIWDDITRPMHPAKLVMQSTSDELREVLWDDWISGQQLKIANELFSTTIHDADYKAVDVKEVVDACIHLNTSQQRDLLNLLKCYTGPPVHLNVDRSITPTHARYYPIARLHLQVYKKELDRLEAIGVLQRCGATDWSSPSFIIPKKDGTVRWITDFRALNRAIIRRKYPLPKIQDILGRRRGYKFFTKLDITMQYYTFVLDEESAD